MHDLEQLRRQLHEILRVKVEWAHLEHAPFDFISQEEDQPFSGWVQDGIVYYPLTKLDKGWNCLAIEEVVLSRSERELISLMINRMNQLKGAVSDKSTDFRLHQVKDWIVRGDQESQPPAYLIDMQGNYANKEQVIPFLLAARNGQPIHMSYSEGGPFFRSFFERETALIPISKREWLLLVDGQLINEAGDEETEQVIESMGAALYEVILAEMAEPITIVAYPLVPWTSLPIVYQEQEMLKTLASTYSPEMTVITPRKLLIEHLLHSAEPLAVVSRWRAIIPTLFESIADPEVFQTLYAFFDNDGRLSETAKALYIHRNTLLYRLDKFKQETGWDVRIFSQAMLVRLAMLMQQSSTK
jgi:hypothetical protein